MASLITEWYKQGKFHLEHDASAEYANLVADYRVKNAGPEEILGIGQDGDDTRVLLKGAAIQSPVLGTGTLDDIVTVDAKNHLAFLVVTFDLASLDPETRKSEFKHNALYAAATNRVDSTGMTEEMMDDPEVVRVRVAHIGKDDEQALWVTKRLKPDQSGACPSQYVFRMDSLVDEADESGQEPALWIVK